MTMEGFLDFLINALLNIYTADTSMNGEKLGLMVSIICIFLTIAFLPISLSWAIFTKDETLLVSKEFKERWGALFEFLNTKKKMARFYNLIFVLRRFIFVMLCFFKNESGS